MRRKVCKERIKIAQIFAMVTDIRTRKTGIFKMERDKDIRNKTIKAVRHYREINIRKIKEEAQEGKA